MRSALRALIAIGLALGTSSCLLVTPPGAHESPPVAADDFCTRIAQATCDGYDHCCTDPMLRMAGFDRAACVTRETSSCTSGSFSIAQAVHDPRTGYDPIVAGAMIATLSDYAARCDPHVVEWSNRRDGLESALTGSVGNGGQCLNGPLTTANYPAFLSCEDFSQACIIDNVLANHANCNARHALSESCVLDFDCREALYCTGLVGGTCAARLPVGGACGSADGTQHHTWCETSFCYAGHCEVPTTQHVYCGDYAPHT